MQMKYTAASAALSLVALAAQAVDPAPPPARALVSPGDLARVRQAMARARGGQPVTLAVIGGSITAGAKASTVAGRYGERVAAWWRQSFPGAEVRFVNAGIGATGSNYGALRAQRDLLAHRPDVVLVEYAVNDGNTQASAETLEGLIRQILKQPQQPAVVQVFMMHRGGGNAQEWHSLVGRHYGLPMVSFRDALWPEIEAGRLAWEAVMADEVHPNDTGHARAAEFVIELLERARQEQAVPGAIGPLPAPRFSACFEFTRLAEAPELKPVRNIGWTLDLEARCWRSQEPGSVIEFEVEGTAIVAMHYVVKRAMGKARLQVDDREPVVYDGWFNQTWGGYRATNLAARDLPPGTHTVRLELLAEKNPGSEGHEFRLLGLGAAGVSTRP